MHSSQGALLARTPAIPLDPPGPTSQASQATKDTPSMDGRTHLHLQDRCTQMGRKTQVWPSSHGVTFASHEYTLTLK